MFKKLSKKKWIVIISICFILFLLGDGIFEMLTFSSLQEDLVGKSLEKINEIRSNVIAASFDISVIFSKFIQFVIIYIPILLAIITYEYYQLKNKLIKFNIGKNDNYNKELNNTKFKLAVIATINIVGIFIFSLCISFIFGGFKNIDNLYKNNALFDENSILRSLFGSNIGILIFGIIRTAIITFLASILALDVVEKIGYVKGILIFWAYLIILSITIYGIKDAPRFLAPLESIILIGKNQNLTIIDIFKNYIIYILPIFFIRIFSKNEVN